MTILPSLDQQIAAQHAESGEEFICQLLDVCLSSYLHDHHHRDGELLLGVFVTGDHLVEDVMDGLEEEFETIAYDIAGERAGYDHDKARKAVLQVREDNIDRLGRVFSHSLETQAELEDEDGNMPDEVCQAWFLLTWQVPEVEGGES